MRGFYRLWIAASLLWIAAFLGWYFWKGCFYGAEVFLGEDQRLWCWSGEGDWYEAVGEFSAGTYARLIAIILIVPIAMLLIGYIIAWVVRGFARPQG
jgi:hypothetical protein